MTDSQQTRAKVVILGNHRARVEDTLENLRPVIQQHADILVEDFERAVDLASLDIDFVIVLGGDGSILRSAKQMTTNQRPVLGVNLGKLGFLADLSPDRFADVFGDVCAGKHRVIDHLMFTCQIIRDGKVIQERLGLNETAILGGPPFSILDIDLYVDSEMVTSYSCDGLIISTPVGSTAHSLSAGGPILRKNLHAFVISAISPHTLTVRPVVDSADRVYEMAVREPSQSTAVVVDGKPIHAMTSADRVCVRSAPQTFKLIEVHGHGYYHTLREKLGWGGQIKKLDE